MSRDVNFTIASLYAQIQQTPPNHRHSIIGVVLKSVYQHGGPKMRPVCDFCHVKRLNQFARFCFTKKSVKLASLFISIIKFIFRTVFASVTSL